MNYRNESPIFLSYGVNNKRLSDVSSPIFSEINDAQKPLLQQVQDQDRTILREAHMKALEAPHPPGIVRV
jgi:hypothetical protein